MRKSSNPVFSSLSESSAKGATQFGGAGQAAFQQGQYGQQGFGAQPGYAAQQPQFATDNRPLASLKQTGLEKLFHSWLGASGRRYICSVYALGEPAAFDRSRGVPFASSSGGTASAGRAPRAISATRP